MKSSPPAFIEFLEPRIAPAFILDTVVTKLVLPDVVVPGDSGSVTFTVTNSGDSDFAPGGGFFGAPGGIHVDFTSTNTGAGFTMSGPEFEDSMPRIAAGKTAKITKAFKIPALDLASPDLPEGSIFVRVDVRADNDYAYSTGLPFEFKFGDVGNRVNVSLAAADSDGTQAKFILAGAGTGDLDVAGGAVNLSFTGTDKGSAGGMTATGGDGLIEINNISASAIMSKVAMVKLDATGNLNFPNGLALGLQLHDIGGVATDKSLTIGNAAGNSVSLIFNRVADMDFNIAPGIHAMKVGEWLDLNADADVLTAKVIEGFATEPVKNGASGDFMADISVTEGSDGIGLGSAKINGDLRGGVWIFGAASPLSVGKIAAGDTTNWRLKATGAVAKITLDSLDDSAIAASTPAIEAQFLGELAVVGDVKAGLIQITGAEEQVAIKNFLVGGALQLTHLNAPGGGILKMAVGSWNGTGGKLDTKYVGTLLVTDDNIQNHFGATLNLPGPDVIMANGKRKFDAPGGIKGSLTTAIFALGMTGNWTVGSNIISLTVLDGSTDSSWVLQGDANFSFLGALKVDAFLNGRLTMSDFGKIEASVISATLEATETMDRDGESSFGGFGSITAKQHISAMDVTATGTIGKISAADWSIGTVTAQTIGSVRIASVPAQGFAGDLANVTFNLSGRSGSLIVSAIDVSVSGALKSVQFNLSNSYLDDFSAGSWDGGGISGGGIDSMRIRGDLQNVQFSMHAPFFGLAAIKLLDVDGLVKSLTLTSDSPLGKISAGAMNGVQMTAATQDLDSLVITGLRDPGSYFVGNNINLNKIGTIVVRNVDPGTASTFSVESVANYKRFDGKALAKTIIADEGPTPAADTAGLYSFTIR